MEEVLFTSEEFVKSLTNISDNLAGKYILPSIREAQDHSLKGILGECLFSTIKRLLKDDEIESDEYGAYKDLLDQCQYYLAYVTITEVTNKISYKISNFGVSKTTDENLQVASYDEIVKMQYYYQSKADAYCVELQKWLIDHKAAFPELTDCQCSKIKANLKSAASCGVWLGGVRGKSKNPCVKRR